MRSVFTKTLRDLRGQVLGWGVAIAVPSVGMVLVFPSLQGLFDLEGLLGSLPAPIQKLVGDPEVLTSLEGFLELKLFESYLPMLLALFALIQGAAAIAGEEERGTMDLLLSQPVPRRRVVVQKLAALAVAVTGVCALVAAALVASATAAGVEADRGWLLLATFAAVPLALVFGSLSLLASSVFHRQRTALMIAGTILFWSVVLQTLLPLFGALRPWLRLSPMSYYSDSVSLGGGLAALDAAVLLGATALLLGASAWAFERKELPA